MGQLIKETGRMTSHTVMELISLLMDPFMKVSLQMALNQGKENTYFLMAPYTLEIFLMVTFMGKAS